MYTAENFMQAQLKNLKRNAMKLIIGKNSFIVRKIEGSLKNFHIISHKDIKSVDLSSYTKIFLFSWDKKTTVRKNTLNILNTIPPEKLYFISTTAIYSIDVRSQWNKYPIFKKNAEDHVKKINGKIIRFGILKKNMIPKGILKMDQ